MTPAWSKEFLDIQASYKVWSHSEIRAWHDNKIQAPSDIWILSYFKIVSRTESKLWHIQNPRYIKNPFNISSEFLAYYDFWYM